MRIGLLSDTHDKLPAMADAVRQLQERQAEFFIHCGDVGTPSVLDYLAGLPAAFVWGNCDWDRPGLERYAQQIHVPCHGPFADLELAGKRIAVLHGDDNKLKRQLLSEQRHD